MRNYFYLACFSNTDDRPLRRSVQGSVRYSAYRTLHPLLGGAEDSVGKEILKGVGRIIAYKINEA